MIFTKWTIILTYTDRISYQQNWDVVDSEPEAQNVTVTVYCEVVYGALILS